MTKSLTKDLCIMADTLMENGVLSYGTMFTRGFGKEYKYIQVHGIDAVMQHGEQFVIEYHNSAHIEFTTRWNDFTIMCLIDYPTYHDWMRKHPDTTVVDWTGGKDKYADVLHLQTDGGMTE